MKTGEMSKSRRLLNAFFEDAVRRNYRGRLTSVADPRTGTIEITVWVDGGLVADVYRFPGWVLANVPDSEIATLAEWALDVADNGGLAPDLTN